MSFSHKCPFCKEELYNDGLKHMPGKYEEDGEFTQYTCRSFMCMINNDFPRYKDVLDCNGRIVLQEYGVGKYYVKVSPEGTSVYGLISYLLVNEVKIARAIWLNVTNWQETLDKLNILVTFS